MIKRVHIAMATIVHYVTIIDYGFPFDYGGGVSLVGIIIIIII